MMSKEEYIILLNSVENQINSKEEELVELIKIIRETDINSEDLSYLVKQKCFLKGEIIAWYKYYDELANMFVRDYASAKK